MASGWKKFSFSVTMGKISSYQELPGTLEGGGVAHWVEGLWQGWMTSARFELLVWECYVTVNGSAIRCRPQDRWDERIATLCRGGEYHGSYIRPPGRAPYIRSSIRLPWARSTAKTSKSGSELGWCGITRGLLRSSQHWPTSSRLGPKDRTFFRSPPPPFLHIPKFPLGHPFSENVRGRGRLGLTHISGLNFPI